MSKSINKVLVVTTWNADNFDLVVDFAFKNKIDCGLFHANLNSIKTLFVPTSGSYDGWGDEILHVEKIESLIQFIDCMKYEDGSNSVEYAYLKYGDNGSEVITNCVNKFQD